MKDRSFLCPSCVGDRVDQRIAFPDYVVFICSACGLSFGVPKLPVTVSAFDNYAWTRPLTRTFPSYIEKMSFSLRKKLGIISALTNRSVNSILDIGCGNGAFLAAASRAGIYAEGIDVDKEHVGFAKAQGLRVFHGEISDFQSNGKYDFVHVAQCLHLVSDTKRFIAAVSGLMNRNGVLYVDSTHADGVASCYRKLFVTPPRYGQLYPPVHNRAFNRKSMSYALENADLRIKKFVTFSSGNPVYCPTGHFSIRQRTVNPLLDVLSLGGFIGCYATKQQV